MAAVLLRPSFSCGKVTERSMRTGLLADYSGRARTTNLSMEPPERYVLRSTKCYWGLSFLRTDFRLSEVVSLLQVRKQARRLSRRHTSTILLGSTSVQHGSAGYAKQRVLVAFALLRAKCIERQGDNWKLLPCRCAGNHAAEARCIDRH